MCASAEALLEWRLLNAATRRLPRELRDAGVPGVQISIVVGDRPVRTWAWGVSRRGTPMSAATRWRIGSLGKPVGAMTALCLHARGVLPLDGDLSSRLSGLCPRGITPRLLLCHASGLRPGLSPHTAIAGVTLEASLRGECGAEFVPRFESAPAAATSYSASGYALLQLAIERATGRAFAEAAQEHVLGPLGLRGAEFTQAARTAPDVACEHGPEGEPLTVCFTPWLASSGLVASAAHLAEVLREVWRCAEGRRGVLSAACAGLMLTPQPQGLSNAGFTCGLSLFEGRDARVLSHGGHRPGLRAMGMLVPGARLAVVMAGNSQHAGPILKRWCGLAHELGLARGEK